MWVEPAPDELKGLASELDSDGLVPVTTGWGRPNVDRPCHDRRRRCAACNKRFTTYETVELRMPQVAKQDGSRTEFDLEKLRTGFMRALHKRPVPTPLVDEAIATITQNILALGEREVPARRIGEMVMRELHRLDQVAYIRFASVYEDFQRVDDRGS